MVRNPGGKAKQFLYVFPQIAEELLIPHRENGKLVLVVTGLRAFALDTKARIAAQLKWAQEAAYWLEPHVTRKAQVAVEDGLLLISQYRSERSALTAETQAQLDKFQPGPFIFVFPVGSAEHLPLVGWLGDTTVHLTIESAEKKMYQQIFGIQQNEKRKEPAANKATIISPPDPAKRAKPTPDNK